MLCMRVVGSPVSDPSSPLFLCRFARIVGRTLLYSYTTLPLINAYLLHYLLEGGTDVLQSSLEQRVHRIPLLQALQDLRVFAEGIKCLLEDGTNFVQPHLQEHLSPHALDH